MPVLSVAIQKGGEGKTTTVVALASFAALNGIKTLLIDFDSQANATSSFLEEETDFSLYDVIKESKRLDDVIVPSNLENLDIVPSNIHIANLERHLITEVNGNYKLKDIIEDNSLKEKYQMIIVDTPPSLGMLTVNALVATDLIVIPVRCAKYSVSGLQDLIETIKQTSKHMNPGLEILGAFINQYDPRRRIVTGIEKDIVNFFNDSLFKTRVRFNTRIEEAALKRKPIFLYDKNSIGAKDFTSLCDEIFARIESRNDRKAAV